MKKYFVLIIIASFSLYGCSQPEKQYTIKCNTWDCLEKNKNKEVIVTGTFQKFTPWTSGKGADHPFWDWEIMLDDSTSVPVQSTYDEINYKYFEGKKVTIKGLIFYGVVIGEDDGKSQCATGFRIDPVGIEEVKE